MNEQEQTLSQDASIGAPPKDKVVSSAEIMQMSLATINKSAEMLTAILAEFKDNPVQDHMTSAGNKAVNERRARLRSLRKNSDDARLTYGRELVKARDACNAMFELKITKIVVPEEAALKKLHKSFEAEKERKKREAQAARELLLSKITGIAEIESGATTLAECETALETIGTLIRDTDWGDLKETAAAQATTSLARIQATRDNLATAERLEQQRKDLEKREADLNAREEKISGSPDSQPDTLSQEDELNRPSTAATPPALESVQSPEPIPDGGNITSIMEAEMQDLRDWKARLDELMGDLPEFETTKFRNCRTQISAFNLSMGNYIQSIFDSADEASVSDHS